MSAARTDWKSLPLEEKPLKERKPKPPSDEGGGPKGRRERKAASFYLRCGNPETGSLPQSTPLTAPSSEGAKGWVSKICIVRGAKGALGEKKPKPPSDEGGGQIII